MAETLCREMRDMLIPHSFSDVSGYVTLSAGVISSMVSRELNAEWFTGLADEALYRSKEGGRNRVTLVVPGETP